MAGQPAMPKLVQCDTRWLRDSPRDEAHLLWLPNKNCPNF
jgi:hypothetical protein